MTNYECALCNMLFAEEDISGSCRNWRECGAEFLCSACCSYDGEDFLCNCCNDKETEQVDCPCCHKDMPVSESGFVCADCVKEDAYCVLCHASVELPVEKSKEYTCCVCGEHFCQGCAKSCDTHPNCSGCGESECFVCVDCE